MTRNGSELRECGMGGGGRKRENAERDEANEEKEEERVTNPVWVRLNIVRCAICIVQRHPTVPLAPTSKYLRQ